MNLITRPPRTYHVSQDAVAEFELAIGRDPRVHVVDARSRALPHALYVPWRMLYEAEFRLGFHVLGPQASGAPRSEQEQDPFIVLMGLEHWKCMPTLLWRGRRSAYLFDSWRSTFPRVEDFVHYWRIEHLFVSSSQVAEMLNRTVSRCAFHWVPEGVDPDAYRYLPYEERDIDVLHVGRRYDMYHKEIAPAMASEGRSYLYEKVKGAIVFPTRDAFVDGLARSKISICVPSSITHPNLSAGIETLTHRYLQSIASKCLVIGHAPKEMIELFGYNPVLEIDATNPVEQLMQLLNGLEEYIPLIERNYTTLLHGHTWGHRWADIARVLFAS